MKRILLSILLIPMSISAKDNFLEFLGGGLLIGGGAYLTYKVARKFIPRAHASQIRELEAQIIAQKAAFAHDPLYFAHTHAAEFSFQIGWSKVIYRVTQRGSTISLSVTRQYVPWRWSTETITYSARNTPQAFCTIF